jgi:hypothetical protein
VICLKINQLGLAWLGAGLAARTRLTRRSLLVKVPSFSHQAASNFLLAAAPLTDW